MVGSAVSPGARRPAGCTSCASPRCRPAQVVAVESPARRADGHPAGARGRRGRRRIQHHVELAAGRWVALLLLLWIGTVPFAAARARHRLRPVPAGGAVPVNFLIFLALSVLGGLLAPVTYFPDALRHLAHALPTYRYAELGWRVRRRTRLPTPAGLAVLAGVDRCCSPRSRPGPTGARPRGR